MNQELKDYLKYILKKSYRQDVRMRLKEGSFEQLSRGKDTKAKSILIIQRQNTRVGTFSDYIVFLKCIEYALEKNMIPVIDRKTIKNDFLPANKKTNTWEYFFKQPLGLGVEEIDMGTMNVAVCYSGGLYPVSLLRCHDSEVIAYWRRLALRYMRFTPKMTEHLVRQQERILKHRRVLGVSVREGYHKLVEMKSGIGKGHALQASNQIMLEDTIKYMKEWNCEYVFLTCQTSDTVGEFVRKFGEQVLYYGRDRKSYTDLAEGDQVRKIKKCDQAFQNEKDYITEIYLLSCCTSLLCSENSGSEAAFIMSKGFEHCYCYDLGTYE